jgi:hypothetical protein
MALSDYPVLCYAAGCQSPAVYKIAARWSDGITHELKTYYLSCAGCLPRLFAAALAKRNACRLASDETLDIPGIYELARGARDRDLRRRPDLETLFATSSRDSS